MSEPQNDPAFDANFGQAQLQAQKQDWDMSPGAGYVAKLAVSPDDGYLVKPAEPSELDVVKERLASAEAAIIRIVAHLDPAGTSQSVRGKDREAL